MNWNNLELPDNPYYQDDAVLIYKADCREILPQLPKVDLVLTSPPYDDLREYGGYSWDFITTAKQLVQVLTSGGVIVWVVGDATIDGSETGSSFRQALRFKELGLDLHDTMIYAKANHPPLTHNRYEQSFEYMFILSKGKPRVFNPIMITTKYAGRKMTSTTFRESSGETRGAHKTSDIKVSKIRDNIWYFNIGFKQSSQNISVFEHPAIFPEELANDHILSWSNPSDLILDPFLGSGTTAYCAKKLNRKCIGIEIEERYCEIAANRCRQTVMNFDTLKERRR